MGKIRKTFNLGSILISGVCLKVMFSEQASNTQPCRWKGRRPRWKLWLHCQPCQIQGLCMEALETFPYFPQPQNNCIVCMKNGPISYLASAGHSLLTFSISLWPYRSVNAPGRQESKGLWKRYTRSTCICMGTRQIIREETNSQSSGFDFY